MIVKFSSNQSCNNLVGGVIAGAIWQENGFLWEIGQKFPALMKITDYYSNQFGRDFYGRNRNNYGGGYDNYYPGLYGHLNNDGDQRNNINNMRTKVILPGKQDLGLKLETFLNLVAR